MNDEEVYYTIALTRMTGFNAAIALELYQSMGSSQAVYEHRNDIGDAISESTPRIREALKNWDDALRRAAAEMEFINKNGIRALTFNDADYPLRLRECPDAPVILYYKGKANLNQQHILNMVGTRHCTTYGQDLVRRFISDLHQCCPQVLIVSGLAYGIDICAHRHALLNGFETVGVLAHGLDELYPTAHRKTAEEMLAQGGLLTEYMFQTRVDKSNFVRRNRIVAGMSDAVVLVESADKGGGLITARIGRDYNREVFAFPGAVGAKFSEGCNLLIRNHEAALIRHAADLVEAMDWPTEKARSKAHEQGVERQLFPDLTDEERKVADALQRQNDQQVNTLSVQADIPVGRLSAILFSLEMKGVVKAMAGGTVHLIK